MIKAGIVGGTGYTGVELLRLLVQHPEVELRAITSRKEAGTPVSAMFPGRRRHERGARSARSGRADRRLVGGLSHPRSRRMGALVQDEARRARARARGGLWVVRSEPRADSRRAPGGKSR